MLYDYFWSGAACVALSEYSDSYANVERIFVFFMTLFLKMGIILSASEHPVIPDSVIGFWKFYPFIEKYFRETNFPSNIP